MRLRCSLRPRVWRFVWTWGRPPRASANSISGCVVFFSSRRRHTRYWRDWSSDVCSSDLHPQTSSATGADSTLPATTVTGSDAVKRGMAEQLKGGVIMDVVTPEQAKIAEDAGAVAVMALERVPADIRVQGGIARMSDPDMIDGIIGAVSIPVMAKARIGHFVEAQVLQSLGVDYIDESEVLTPADEAHHIAKREFTAPFVCGATDLGEALRRIAEGAAMIRSKGEAGTGNVVEATRHMRAIRAGIKRLGTLDETELFVAAKEIGRAS